MEQASSKGLQRPNHQRHTGWRKFMGNTSRSVQCQAGYCLVPSITGLQLALRTATSTISRSWYETPSYIIIVNFEVSGGNGMGAQ